VYLRQKFYQTQTEHPFHLLIASSPHERKQKYNNLRTTTILLRPHPSTNRHTPCKPHGNSVLLQKI
ncbi:hypothetical protein, partial [Bacteroides xylanisolvens]|uniref:hypothetical protein n=1 Tax=Bacteroides xylanisolvens TaxID=371601 RepID=UPI0034A3F8D0